MFFFLTAFPWPSALKRNILKIFGSKIGKNIVIKPRVNILFPWKLEIGDYSWLGEEVWILNFEKVKIGSHSCVSQRSFLCGGNHDYRDPHFSYKNGPIIIEDAVWVGASCFIGPDVVIGKESVVTAGSVITKSLPPGKVCSGNPCIVVKERYK